MGEPYQNSQHTSIRSRAVILHFETKCLLFLHFWEMCLLRSDLKVMKMHRLSIVQETVASALGSGRYPIKVSAQHARISHLHIATLRVKNCPRVSWVLKACTLTIWMACRDVAVRSSGFAHLLLFFLSPSPSLHFPADSSSAFPLPSSIYHQPEASCPALTRYPNVRISALELSESCIVRTHFTICKPVANSQLRPFLITHILPNISTRPLPPQLSSCHSTQAPSG